MIEFVDDCRLSAVEFFCHDCLATRCRGCLTSLADFSYLQSMSITLLSARQLLTICMICNDPGK